MAHPVSEKRYVNSDGNLAFVYLNPMPRNEQLLFSPDGGRTLNVMRVTDLFGDENAHTLSFYDPYDGQHATIRVWANGEYLVYEGLLFKRTDANTDDASLVLPPAEGKLTTEW
ncbi:MAG: hypothetical protein JWN38_906 [Candidatus Saccharibacteria bacterium]|nr:hypothetical protein [Candidatus Saccharibacteria bacterium]